MPFSECFRTGGGRELWCEGDCQKILAAGEALAQTEPYPLSDIFHIWCVHFCQSVHEYFFVPQAAEEPFGNRHRIHQKRMEHAEHHLLCHNLWYHLSMHGSPGEVGLCVAMFLWVIGPHRRGSEGRTEKIPAIQKDSGHSDGLFARIYHPERSNGP